MTEQTRPCPGSNRGGIYPSQNWERDRCYFCGQWVDTKPDGMLSVHSVIETHEAITARLAAWYGPRYRTAVDVLAERFAQCDKSIRPDEAQAQAERYLRRDYENGVVNDRLAVLADGEPACTNCGLVASKLPAYRHDRCHRCQYLASDHD